MKHYANPTVRPVAAGRSLTHSTRKVNTPLKTKMFLFVAKSVAHPICLFYFVSLQSDLPKTKDATEYDRDCNRLNSQYSNRLCKASSSCGLTDPMYLQHGGQLGVLRFPWTRAPIWSVVQNGTPGTSGMLRQGCSVYWTLNI
jgi:hypothetical protein